MTAQEFKDKFNAEPEYKKVIIRNKVIRELPCHYSSFYRKMNDLSWTATELFFIEQCIWKN